LPPRAIVCNHTIHSEFHPCSSCLEREGIPLKMCTQRLLATVASRYTVVVGSGDRR
jgi:hypothetical protein